MAVVSVDALITGLLKLGERIYKAREDRKDAWDDYESKVDELGYWLNFYYGRKNLGQQLPDQLDEALQNATTELDKFKKESTKWSLLRPDPQKLGKTVSKFIEDITVNIRKRLSLQERIAAELEERQPITEFIHNNGENYVPTEKTLSAVIKAISDQTGPSIILLHGEFGKGKTTLAKYVFHLYSEPRSNADTKRRGLENHDFKAADMKYCRRGLKARHALKTQELILQKLSPGEFSEPGSLGSLGTLRTEQRFRNFLSKNKTLLILDDVSDEQFLLAMWRAAPEGGNHKYLVTSRVPTLCNSLKKHSKTIRMGNATEEEANKILAVHAGLKRIPNKLEGAAKEIIEKTGRNPLALGCWAGALPRHDNANEQAWMRGCSEDLTKLLNNSERNFVLWGDHEKDPQSFWEAMEGCFQSLHMDSKIILFFIYACKGTSVPEELLRNLHKQVETTKHSCEWSLNELSVKGIVKSKRDGLELYKDLESKYSDKKQRKSRTMSLTPLGNLYMFRSKFRWADNPEIVSVTDALVNGWERTDQMGTKERDEARVTIILCALYFDRNHPDQIVTNARKAAASHMKDADHNIDKRRHAAEPVLWLLDQPRQDWKEILCSARKVFLEYVCKSKLDDASIRMLLNSSNYPQAQLAALETLLSIVTTETTPLISSSSRDLLKALTGFLDSEKGLIEDTAFKTVEYIVKNQVKFLSGDKPDKQQLEAARVLTTLASAPSDRMKETIVDRALKALVNLLNLDKGPLRKTEAALALRNLASTKEKKIKEKILNEALAGLVGCLFEDKNSDLQEATASTLRNLAAMEKAFKLKIVKERKALTGLMHLFIKPDKPGLQKEAAATLKSVAFGNDATKEQIVNADKMLECFATFLSEDEGDSVLELVAGALWGLAFSRNDSIKKKIVETPKVLEGLVKALSKHDKPSMQKEAAGAVNKLSLTGDESVRRKIKNQPRLLDELTAASKKDTISGLQTQAKEALKNLG